MSIPTTPGPYWWRAKDGDEWELVTVEGFFGEYRSASARNPYPKPVKSIGGQWVKAHNPDELATLRAKADAYDNGVEGYCLLRNGELWVNELSSERDDIDDLISYCEKQDDITKYKCCKVRVCEVVDLPNGKGEA